jgi:hypothetical protein
MNRLDKDEDDKICYMEFLRNIMPRLNVSNNDKSFSRVSNNS